MNAQAQLVSLLVELDAKRNVAAKLKAEIDDLERDAIVLFRHLGWTACDLPDNRMGRLSEAHLVGGNPSVWIATKR